MKQDINAQTNLQPPETGDNKTDSKAPPSGVYSNIEMNSSAANPPLSRTVSAMLANPLFLENGSSLEKRYVFGFDSLPSMRL